MLQATLAQIIGAIGEDGFVAVASDALCGFMGFDLAAVFVHHREARPYVMFDNFDRVGGRRGVQNYVRFTHRINPILAHAPVVGARRARDFGKPAIGVSGEVGHYLVWSANEELGFRTLGWPERLEEIGLYFEAYEGIVELGLYRERGRNIASSPKLRALAAIRAPLAAAFERNRLLSAKRPPPPSSAARMLSARESQVCELLLLGCSSAAIALRLDISLHTVKDHRKQIFRKLGVGSLAQLFAMSGSSNQPPPWRDGLPSRRPAICATDGNRG